MKEKTKILCIDDNIHDRELIRDALEKEAVGFEMTEIKNQEEFEELVSYGEFDLVLTDFNILGFDGLEVVQKIKKKQPDLPVIIITGTGSEEIAVRALQEGADDYVIKTPKHIAHLPSTIRKILEMKEDQKKIREMESNIKNIVKHISDGILVISKNREILFINPMAKKLLGKNETEILGENFIGQEFVDETRGTVLHEGKYLAIKVAKTIWSNQEAFIISIRDVTKQKKNEDAIRMSEEKYRLLAETTRDIIVLHDMDGKIIFLNQAGLDFSGYTREEVTGKNISEFVPPEEIEKMKVRKEIRSKGNSSKHIYESVFINKSGERIPVEVNSSGLISTDEKMNILLVARDITERKIAEQQLKKNLKEKEVLLRELYHRTKNNMQLISSMLRLKADHLQDKKLQEVVDEIELKIKSMSLVHQKLYESRDLSLLNLKYYLQDLIILVQRSYQLTGKKIDIEFNGIDKNVLLDTAIPLGLVFNELMIDCFKYAFPDDRSGKIRVDLSSPKKNEIQLIVSDNGVGFPDGFDLEKDSGLGLRLARDIVRNQLDGDIQSISDKGVTHIITFKEDIGYKERI